MRMTSTSSNYAAFTHHLHIKAFTGHDGLVTGFVAERSPTQRKEWCRSNRARPAPSCCCGTTPFRALRSRGRPRRDDPLGPEVGADAAESSSAAGAAGRERLGLCIVGLMSSSPQSAARRMRLSRSASRRRSAVCSSSASWQRARSTNSVEIESGCNGGEGGVSPSERRQLLLRPGLRLTVVGATKAATLLLARCGDSCRTGPAFPWQGF
jgi:hypothetical protein